MANDNLHLLQSAGILVYLLVLFFLSHAHRGTLPHHVIWDWANRCEYYPPGEYRAGPYGRSVRWCPGRNPQLTLHLTNHMQVRSEGMDGVFALEFGSAVKCAYLTRAKLFMFNAEIIKASNETFTCYMVVGPGVLEPRTRPRLVTVGYTTMEDTHKTAEFEGNDACIVQALVEGM